MRAGELQFPEQVYITAECASFLKSKEGFGGLSNMAGGFGLRVQGHPVKSSEALYQALKFPDSPAAQRTILDKPSPMTAKWAAKGFIKQGLLRPDWDQVEVEVMRWCLRLKLAQNPRTMGRILSATGELPIVEIAAKKDGFWGAVREQDGTVLRGRNVLGCLLTELRQVYRAVEMDERQNTPAPGFDCRLLGQPVTAHREKTPV